MRNYRTILLAVLLGIMITGCSNPSKEGVEYLEAGQYKEAVEQFEAAIEKGKNTGDAYRGIGIARWEQEDYEGAAEAFEQALEEGAQKTGTIYNFLGNCGMKLGDATSALNYYRRALGAEDSSKELIQEVKYNMIAAYEQGQDWESAKVQLAEYLAEYPEDVRAQKEAEFLETR